MNISHRIGRKIQLLLSNHVDRGLIVDIPPISYGFLSTLEEVENIMFHGSLSPVLLLKSDKERKKFQKKKEEHTSTCRAKKSAN